MTGILSGFRTFQHIMTRVVLDSSLWRWLDSDSFPKQPDLTLESSGATKIWVDSTPTQTVQQKIWVNLTPTKNAPQKFESTRLRLQMHHKNLSRLDSNSKCAVKIEPTWLWLKIYDKILSHWLMFKVFERDWLINLNGTDFARISLWRTNA